MSVFVIAEIGINHNGSLENAKKLIDMAKDCGCDAVKFQKRTVDLVYSKEFLESPRESPWGKTQRAQKCGLELSRQDYDEIDRYCKKLNILWSASAWDMKSQIFLQKYNLSFNKLASAMITYAPLVSMVASERKHTYISTGMSSYSQIDKCVDIFRQNNCPFTLMHCVSVYPCQDSDLNLNHIPVLQKKYNSPVGYSGHEVGLLPSVVAVLRGAVAIERHITLDRAGYGSDQSASLEYEGLRRLVRDIRSIDAILGDGKKVITEGELKTEKSLRYFDDLRAGSSEGRQ